MISDEEQALNSAGAGHAPKLAIMRFMMGSKAISGDGLWPSEAGFPGRPNTVYQTLHSLEASLRRISMEENVYR